MILKKICCWFLAVICASVGMGIDFLLFVFSLPRNLSTTIVVIILFSALFGLLTFSLIAESQKSRNPKSEIRNKKLVVSEAEPWNGSKR